MRPISAVKYDFYKRRMPELISQFPDLFNKRYPVPLGIGTCEHLVKLTSFTKKEVSVLLYVWCGRVEYTLMALSMGSRVGIDSDDPNLRILKLMDDGHRTGFKASFKEIKPSRIKRFCKGHLKEFGRPALLSLPIRERPDLGTFKCNMTRN